LVGCSCAGFGACQVSRSTTGPDDRFAEKGLGRVAPPQVLNGSLTLVYDDGVECPNGQLVTLTGSREDAFEFVSPVLFRWHRQPASTAAHFSSCPVVILHRAPYHHNVARWMATQYAAYRVLWSAAMFVLRLVGVCTGGVVSSGCKRCAVSALSRWYASCFERITPLLVLTC
jgi:hypothetical protein